ncbi:hypothetical protein GCM10020358_04410 [Amorphoplanes nipponensis]|uniref:Uncharacterized protein n=1 Tax=Actinoplanes nipponensis TaxID=135950 RepID=A0A919JJE2_9ACTN|nr:hypothetical protein Ani05nite_39040 [Actinoplanes nipponensis]
MDGPRPPSFTAPSIWYAAVAAPQTKPSGNRTLDARGSSLDSTETVAVILHRSLHDPPPPYRAAPTGLISGGTVTGDRKRSPLTGTA